MYVCVFWISIIYNHRNSTTHCKGWEALHHPFRSLLNMLSLCLSVCLSVCISVCLSISLSLSGTFLARWRFWQLFSKFWSILSQSSGHPVQWKKYDNKPLTPGGNSITKLSHYAECHYAKCHSWVIAMLSVIMMSVILLSVVILSVEAQDIEV